MTVFTDKMSEFCRRKNREIDELKKERDHEKSQKEQLMQDYENFVKLNEVNEQKILQKFCVVLNEKKNRIKELKSILEAIEGEQ